MGSLCGCACSGVEPDSIEGGSGCRGPLVVVAGMSSSGIRMFVVLRRRRIVVSHWNEI